MSVELEGVLNALCKLRSKCKNVDVDLGRELIKDVFNMVGSMLDSNGIVADNLISDMTKMLYLSENSNEDSISLSFSLLEDILKIVMDMADKMDGNRKEIVSTIKQCHRNTEYCYEKKYGFKDRKKIGKYVIYTVITGGYDTLKIPTYVDENADYICYTDDKDMKSEVWEIRCLDNKENYNAVTLSRLPKILPHKFLPEYEYSVYVDGKIRCTGNFEEYIKVYGKDAPMLCFPHFARDCIYDEAEECINLNLDDEAKIRKQMSIYRSKGMPEHSGLIEACCMVRKHNDKSVMETMEIWWEEFRKWNSRRDQLSFNYACWKTGLEYDICNLYSYNNNYINEER